MNAIRAADISIYTSTDEADEANYLEDNASDKKIAAAVKADVVAKGEATKASKTDT